MNKKTQAIQLLVSSLYKNSKGEKFIPTQGQCDIFEAVTNPKYKWVWLSAPTRYGKSDTLGMSLIYLAAFHGLKIPIVAGSQEKANKIMEYIVAHLADHPVLSEGLINVDANQVEKLKVRVSKEALRWHSGGWIYITSVDSRNVTKEGEGVVGEGGDVVVLEEAGLIRRPEQFSKIVRMVEGDWGKMIMSGNAIENSVFETAFNDPSYYKVRVTLDQAIKEGRINEERLEQQKKYTTARDWKRYYLVEFPEDDDGKVFRNFKRVMTALPKKPNSENRYVAGVDLARHQDYTVIAIYNRNTNEQVYQDRFNQLEWTTQKRRIRAITKYYNNAYTVIDGTGVGDPIVSDLMKSGVRVKPIKFTNTVKEGLIDDLVIKIEQEQIKMLSIEDTVEEFGNFSYRMTESGNIVYNAREGYHDDIVIAHALAVSDLHEIIIKSTPEELTRVKRDKLRQLAKRNTNNEYYDY